MTPAKPPIPKIEGTGPSIAVARAVVALVTWGMATERIATLILVCVLTAMGAFAWIHVSKTLDKHNSLIDTLVASELKQAEAQVENAKAQTKMAEAQSQQTEILRGVQSFMQDVRKEHADIRRDLDEIKSKTARNGQ